MKRLIVFLVLLFALGASPAMAQDPSAEALAPMMATGQPGSWFDLPTSTCLANPYTQYQDPPDPCLVCGGWEWPEPGEGNNNLPGPQCNPGEYYSVANSCSCPATGGGTIGGMRITRYHCNSQAFWIYFDTGQCRTGGSPSWCV